MIIVCLKDEGSNFNAITIALKSIVSCEILGLEESFQGTCFDHVFLMHVNIEEKVC